MMMRAKGRLAALTKADALLLLLLARAAMMRSACAGLLLLRAVSAVVGVKKAI